MAGREETAAFNEQNRIRQKPREVQKDVQEQMTRFDPSGQIMSNPGGISLRTNAGIGEWREAD